jgi:hypothetical protein
LRLLLDEMHAPAAAVALRKSGYDVVAVAEGPLRSSADVDVLAEATLQHRAVVTENVRDFRAIAADWALVGRRHGGILFTPRQRFPRCATSYPKDLIRALKHFLADPPALTDAESWEWWLDS